MQSVALSGLLACRDSLTPLKVVLVAAGLNFAGDWLLCAWPYRTGIIGAAAATAVSTLAGFTLMLRALCKKGLRPELRPPSWQELRPLLEYARPLATIILTRFLGLTCMALAASELGIVPQAAYQVLINFLLLFGLWGEPLSQTAQTVLPQFIDAGPSAKSQVRRSLRSLFLLTGTVSLTVGMLSAAALRFGSAAFTQDAAVIDAVRGAGLPAVPICISLLVFSQAIDGTLIASRDFDFTVALSVFTCGLNLLFLWVAVFQLRWGLSSVIYSLGMRYVVFLVAVTTLACTGRGTLGAAVQGLKQPKRP